MTDLMPLLQKVWALAGTIAAMVAFAFAIFIVERQLVRMQVEHATRRMRYSIWEAFGEGLIAWERAGVVSTREATALLTCVNRKYNSFLDDSDPSEIVKAFMARAAELHSGSIEPLQELH